MPINRKNDYAFKRIFGHEDSKDVLARFLSVILDTSIEADELTLIQTELSPEFLADKASVLDIQVKRSLYHEQMHVEMQQRDKGNTERKVLFYNDRSFVSTLKQGRNYSELPRQVSIFIADYDIFKWKNPAKFHGIFNMRDRDEGLLLSDAQEIHVLELPKLRRQPSKGKWNSLECWLHYLDNKEGKVMEQILEQEPMIRRAMEIEEAFMQNESERYLYELREKGSRDFANAMSTAEQRGEQRGRLEGKLEGKLEGMREAARSMLLKKTPIEFIQEVTGLSEEEIKSLH